MDNSLADSKYGLQGRQCWYSCHSKTCLWRHTVDHITRDLVARNQQSGDHVVDVSKAGDVALDASDWTSHGGQRIKQISDFLKRVTAPDADSLTYSEARQFLRKCRSSSDNARNAEAGTAGTEIPLSVRQ